MEDDIQTADYYIQRGRQLAQLKRYKEAAENEIPVRKDCGKNTIEFIISKRKSKEYQTRENRDQNY